MRSQANNLLARAGRVSYGLIAGLLGLPLPIVIIALLWGGCTHW